MSARRAAFAKFTASFIGNELVVVLDGEVLALTVLDEPADGALIVRTSLSDEEIADLDRCIATPLPFEVRYVGKK